MSIFEENIAYRPFKYPWAVAAAKQHSIEMHWHENQIELQDDIRQWNTVGGLATPNVSHEVNKNIIGKLNNLFVEMDAIVGEGYTKILPYVKNNEIRNMLMTFASREVIHQRSYALLAETLGTTDSGWKEFKEYKEMKEKLDSMAVEESDLSVKLNFAKALAKILLGEGIGLFGAFATFLNYKRYGLLMGFNTVNEWSLADEQFHVRYNIRVLDEVRKELSEVDNIELERYIEETIANYLNAEIKFIDLMFAVGEADGLPKKDLVEYIWYLGDLRKYQLGMISAEEVRENPLDWMDWILGAIKHGSFFEKRIADYSHTGLVGEIDYSKYLIDILENE